MPPSQSSRAPSSLPSHPDAAPARHDLYTRIHKALRLFMTDTLARLGRVDSDRPAELHEAMVQLRSLLSLLRHHALHENDFMLPTLEARLPGASQRNAAEHAQHLEAIDALHDAADEAEAAAPPQRAAMLPRLYRELALFVAHHFEHMHDEETALAETLWSVCDDAELAAIDRRIQAQLLPQEQALGLRWIAASATVPELVRMLTAIRQMAPAEVHAGMLASLREELDAPRRARLDEALSSASD